MRAPASLSMRDEQIVLYARRGLTVPEIAAALGHLPVDVCVTLTAALPAGVDASPWGSVAVRVRA